LAVWMAAWKPASIYARRRAMYSMFGCCAARYMVASLRTKHMDSDGEFALHIWETTHARIAEDMYRTMATLRGFWVKFGQVYGCGWR
jgi:hypothetical protein